MAKSTIWQVLFFWWLSLSLVIWSRIGDLIVSQNLWKFVCLALPGRFWVLHIPLVHISKFKFLAQFLMGHLAHSFMLNLILFWGLFAAFANYIWLIILSLSPYSLQGDMLAPYLFIICLDYVLRTSIDNIRENGFELTKKRSRRYPAKTITDTDYADDIALLAKTPNQAETQLHSLEQAAAGIGLHVNAQKTEFMCFNQKGDISTLDGTSLKLVDKFTHLGSSIWSTEKDIDTRLTKAWTAIDRLSIIWKSNLTGKMKRSFFQAAVVSILLYGCTTWTLTKRLEKKLDGNYTWMLRAILNRSWQQHPTRRQLYGHLPPITKTIQARQTRHAGHCWRSKDKIVSDVLLWTPAYGQSKAGRPARTFIQQLCDDTGCNPEDLPKAMNDRETWRERVRDIRACCTSWWWWWWLCHTGSLV